MSKSGSPIIIIIIFLTRVGELCLCVCRLEWLMTAALAICPYGVCTSPGPVQYNQSPGCSSNFNLSERAFNLKAVYVLNVCWMIPTVDFFVDYAAEVVCEASITAMILF